MFQGFADLLGYDDSMNGTSNNHQLFVELQFFYISRNPMPLHSTSH
jgi:hypothetical protein